MGFVKNNKSCAIGFTGKKWRRHYAKEGSMKHFLVKDFGTIVTCEKRSEVPLKLGYKNRAEMIQDNGWVNPVVCELTDEEYRLHELCGEYDEV